MKYKTFGCGGSCGTCDCSHEDELLLDADDELENDKEKKDKKDDVLGDLEDDEDNLSDLGEIKDTDDVDEEETLEDDKDLDWSEDKDEIA